MFCSLAAVPKGNAVTQLYEFARFEVLSAVLSKSCVLVRLGGYCPAF